MGVGGGEDYRKWNAFAVRNKMALRAQFASICWILANYFAPFFAGMLAESREARVQSILPAFPSRFKSTWCRRCHTPAFCQSRSRRQQVLPEP